MAGVLVRLDNFSTSLVTVTDLVTESPEYVFNDPTQRKIIAALLTLATVIGVPGNSLVIFAVASSKKLQTKTNAFVVSLAVSDLTTALVLPFQAVALLTDQWPLPEIVCSLVAGTMWIGVGSSVYSIAMIAFNRYYLITRPRFQYDRLYSNWHLALMIGFPWAWPMFYVIVPPLCGVGSMAYAARYRICTADSSHHLSDLYAFLSSFVGGVPCLVVIAICYTMIFRFIRRKTRAMNWSSLPTRSMGIESSTAQDTRSTAAFRRQVQVTKNMFLVVCMYLINVMPFTVTCLFPEKYHVIPWVLTILLMNCCVNPIIYGLKHPQFRKVFKKIISCKLREIEEPSKILHSITSSTT